MTIENVFLAGLIKDVLEERKTVLEALNSLPKNSKNPNVKCVFDALMHREADEDLRKDEEDYAAVQDEYLRDLAQILENNENIPKNIIENYNKFHEDTLISDDTKGFSNIVKYIKRRINF